MPNTEEFRRALAGRFRDAERHLIDHLDVNAGDLHRDLGDYPGPNHAMASCCAVMDQARKPGDVILAGPPSGKGASLTIRYKLPR